jgi:hypothetical protein
MKIMRKIAAADGSNSPSLQDNTTRSLRRGSADTNATITGTDAGSETLGEDGTKLRKSERKKMRKSGVNANTTRKTKDAVRKIKDKKHPIPDAFMSKGWSNTHDPQGLRCLGRSVYSLPLYSWNTLSTPIYIPKK